MNSSSSEKLGQNTSFYLQSSRCQMRLLSPCELSGQMRCLYRGRGRGAGRRTSGSISFGPVPAKFLRSPDDPVRDILRNPLLVFDFGGIACGRNLQQLQFFKDRFHRARRIAKKIRAAHACKDPTHALEHGLPVHVFGKFFEWVVAIAVALNGKTPATSFDDQVNAEGSNFPMWGDAIPRAHEALHDFALEARLRALFFFFQ